MSYSTSGPVETILRKEDTVDPVAGNDNTQGYAIKSRWINTSSNEEWVCTDASTGAALWELTTGGDGDVTSDGTTAQDAVFLTERSDHVNTFPDPGNAEIWIKAEAQQDLVFTTDTGEDREILTINAVDETQYRICTMDTTGKAHVNTFPNLTTNAGNDLVLGVAGAGLICAEGATGTGPPVATGQGGFWVKTNTPNVAIFTDDAGTDHVLNTASSVTMAANALVDVDATEVVIGGAYIEGNDYSTFSWEILGTYNDNGGTGVQDLDVYLYDRGPDGTPVAGVLRSIISIDTLDTLDRVTQTLTASGTPGVDTDTIFNTGRLYEVRAKLDAGGGVDTAKILSVRFIES